MKNIRTSAPGKLMLLGEHAVVHNHPCIVTAVGQRMKAIVTLLDSDDFELEAPDVNVSSYKKSIKNLGLGDIPKGAQFVEIAVKNVITHYPELMSKSNSKAKGLRIETSSEFSSLFGFGSSSASTVCVVKALVELFELKVDNKTIFDLAYKTVLDIQGKGSGFDVAAAVYGGTLYFVTGGKVIETLAVDAVPLQVGYSGIKADTVTLINQVGEKAKKYPEIIDGMYDLIEKLVERAKEAMVIKDWQTMGELMNLNQGLLESMGVSIDKLSRMIYAARQGGAYGAKLSGGGGGDCMITIAPESKREEVKKNIQDVGGEIIDVQTNVDGVRIEKLI